MNYEWGRQKVADWFVGEVSAEMSVVELVV